MGKYLVAGKLFLHAKVIGMGTKRLKHIHVTFIFEICAICKLRWLILLNRLIIGILFNPLLSL